MSAQRQHNPDDGRKCWGTKREKERLRARYLIRDRVIGNGNALVAHEQQIDNDGDDNDNATDLISTEVVTTTSGGIDSTTTTTSCRRRYSTQLSQDQIVIVQKYIGYIKNGDKSKFSLSSMSKHVNVLMTQLPITQVGDVDNGIDGDDDSIITLNHTIQLCLAWYGVEYSTFLLRYIKSLRTVTIMEYSIWMGKYSILHNLLIGGINPCIRSSQSQLPCTDDNDNDGEDEGSTSSWNQQRLQAIGTRVLQRFFTNFPIKLSSYIVKCVADMRMYAYYSIHNFCKRYDHSNPTTTRHNEEEEEGVQAAEAGAISQLMSSSSSSTTTTCHTYSCNLCSKSSIPSDCMLRFPSSCDHIFCEICFWNDLLEKIDQRHNLDNVVLCPICFEAFDYRSLPTAIQRQRKVNNNRDNDKPSMHHNKSNPIAAVAGEDKKEKEESLGTTAESSLTTPSQRRMESLTRYLSLPKNRKELKSKVEKRKKLTEEEYLSSSWIDSIKLSLGNTQDVRRDKFFYHVEKSSLHYVHACLKLGVNVNWVNEYGQTPLYISVWKAVATKKITDITTYNHNKNTDNNKNDTLLDIIDLLLSYGADPSIKANGGSTIYDLINNNSNNTIKPTRKDALMKILEKFNDMMTPPLPTTTTTKKKKEESNNTNITPTTTTTRTFSFHMLSSCSTTYYNEIPTKSFKCQTLIGHRHIAECHHHRHPGAGSYIIDDTLPSKLIECLLELRKIIPEDDESSSSQKKKKKTKGIPCSTRSYYCDSEGYICNVLTKIIESSGLIVKTKKRPTRSTTTTTMTTPTSHSVVVFPHMRFLHYGTEGTELAPHVDLCRVDSSTGIRSTHSFLLYLTDCEEGGETSLLGAVSGDGRNQVLAAVSPKRGRLLLFPHACPHEGNRVVNVPKTLLRGEVTIPCPDEA